jgi:hypothetical protein
MSRHQNTGRNHCIKVANKSFENVAKFQHLGKTVAIQNFIHEEIKSKLHPRNTSYHDVQNLLSSRLIPKILD